MRLGPIVAMIVHLVVAEAPTALTLDQVKVDLPQGWTRQTMLKGTVLLLLAPKEEAGWQANVFIELRRDNGNRSLEKMVDDLLPNLKQSKKGFKLTSRKEISHRSGRKACVIEYTHELKGVALRERELIMPLRDDVVLFGTAAGADVLWQKYEPSLAGTLDSIDIVDKAGK